MARTISDIVSMQQCFDYLEITCPGETEQRFITFLKRRVETAVRRFLQSGVTQATYTHFMPQGSPFDRRNMVTYGTEHLWLPEYPVRSITQLREDTSAYASAGTSAWPVASLLTSGSDYYLDLDQSGLCRWGKVIRLNTFWPAIPRSIRIVYTAGWSADELAGDVADWWLDASDIQVAVLQGIANEYSKRGSGGGGEITSEQLADFKISYSTGSTRDEFLTTDMREKLQRFRRMGWPQ